ncbi:MAG: universal stress protein [Acidimicrobiales bacterium]
MSRPQDPATLTNPAPPAFRIVVGVDGSAPSERAVDFACEEARRWGGSLLLVHGWDYPYSGAMGALPDIVPEILSAAHRLLESAAARARVRCGPDIPIATLLTQGNAAGALLHQCAGADSGDSGDGGDSAHCMIVVGSRGRGGFTSLLLGSVSHQVVHHATVPVAIVPDHDRHHHRDRAPDTEPCPIRRLVVGIDGSPESLRAVHWAAEHAQRDQAGVLLLNVFQVPKLTNPMSLLTPPDAAEQLAALGERLCLQARAVVNDVAPDSEVHHRVTQGMVANELVAATEPGDLLIIGAVGADGAVRAVLGRVTEHVISHARTPVVVVP